MKCLTQLQECEACVLLCDKNVSQKNHMIVIFEMQDT